jgi:hypothetical protein
MCEIGVLFPPNSFDDLVLNFPWKDSVVLYCDVVHPVVQGQLDCTMAILENDGTPHVIPWDQTYSTT